MDYQTENKVSDWGCSV